MGSVAARRPGRHRRRTSCPGCSPKCCPPRCRPPTWGSRRRCLPGASSEVPSFGCPGGVHEGVGLVALCAVAPRYAGAEGASDRRRWPGQPAECWSPCRMGGRGRASRRRAVTSLRPGVPGSPERVKPERRTVLVGVVGRQVTSAQRTWDVGCLDVQMPSKGRSEVWRQNFTQTPLEAADRTNPDPTSVHTRPVHPAARTTPPGPVAAHLAHPAHIAHSRPAQHTTHPRQPKRAHHGVRAAPPGAACGVRRSRPSC